MNEEYILTALHNLLDKIVDELPVGRRTPELQNAIDEAREVIVTMELAQ